MPKQTAKAPPPKPASATATGPDLMNLAAERYWPTICRLALEGWNLIGITGYCQQHARGSNRVTVEDVAAVIRLHADELTMVLQKARAFPMLDGKFKEISAAADEARQNIKAICIRASSAPITVPSASTRAFANLRKRIMRQVSVLSVAA